MEISELMYEIEPVEFDPFAEPESQAWRSVADLQAESMQQGIELTPVAFNPFEGPEIELIVRPTEPQNEIWASCVIGGTEANCAYNECFSLSLNGQLDLDAISRAIQGVADMHQSLRMAFSPDGTSICVFKKLTIPVIFQDLAAKSCDEQKTEIDQYRKKCVITPFDLVNGPLCNTALFKLNENEHVLVFTVHHIICDGWSVGIILQDLSRLYNTYLAGGTPDVAGAPLFSEYAQHEIEFSRDKTYQENEIYWTEQFKGSDYLLNLPTDFPRPAVRTFKSSRVDFILDANIADSVKKLGRTNGASLVTTLLAAFEVFLHQLTGQEDITVGMPAAGQPATGNYRLVGHCVNLLALRSFPKGEIAFKEYLRQRKTNILDAYDHQLYTFGSLLKKLNVPRDPSRVPLVPVMFNIDMGLDNDVKFDGLNHQIKSYPREYENFELFLNIAGNEDSPVFEWSYNTQLFKAESIKKMMNSFEFLLKELVNEPEILIKNITELNANELIAQLAEWNNTQYPYPANAPIHKLVSVQATNLPDKIALTFGKQKISYKQLDEQANRLASLLIRNGVQKSDKIAFSIDRSPEMLITMIAIAKAGAIYVPLDPSFPLNRINYMLEDSQASMLLVSRNYKGRYQLQATELVIEDLWATLNNYPPQEPEIAVNGDDLAYILYTSGSTGNPKGVQITHKNLVNFLISMQKEPGMSSADKLLAVTTISFDIAGLELFLPLVSGAEIVLADTPTAKDGKALLDIIRREEITVMQATPYTWRILLEAGWDKKTPVKVICGGEALPQELAQKLTDRASSVWNVYGPTETTIWSTVKQLSAADSLITIGRPINNTSVYILDKFQKPLAAGIAGEIFIGGDGVAKGYLNRPELTAEKFINDPFSKQSGAKMYRTGDLGKFLPDGEIVCLGRIDSQVKIRGYRIETGEIEFQLSKQDEVKEAVVIARPDNQGIDKLVAFIVPDSESDQIPEDELIQRWKENLNLSLPGYMVPDNFILVPAMPLTPNGKVDRKALAKHGIQTSGKQADLFTAPRTTAEKLLSDIWKECLGLEKISVHDNFFDLGGHSLIAVKVMTRIEKETDTRLPLAALFESPTIEKLAHVLEPGAKTVTWDSLVPIKPHGTKMPLYMVHGAGLNVLLFNALAQNMSPDQPVFGLQAKGLNGVDEPLDNIEDIAAHYINSILEQNPTGPYALAGYSFGGIIAFEMARQLEALGKEVKMLAMFDTYAYRSPHYDPVVTKFYKRSKFFLKRFFYAATFKTGFKTTIQDKSTNIKRKLKRIYWKLRYGKNQTQAGIFGYSNKVDVMNEKAQKYYQLKPYNIAVEIFRAENKTFYMDDFEYLGWKPYALKGVNIHKIPGEHNTIFKSPNDKVFAKILQQCLDDAILKP